MDFRFQVQTKINKPVDQVFDAVYNPTKLSCYFTTAGSSGPLKEGSTVQWSFEKGHCDKVSVPVTVEKAIPNQLIRFKWDASDGEYDAKTGEFPKPAGYQNTVEMIFEALDRNETLVRIIEGSWRQTPEGLKASYQNCQGWTHMSSCLKAYLEYDINLRK